MKSIRTFTAALATTALVAAGAPAALAQSTTPPERPSDAAGQTERPAKKKKGRRGPRRLSAAQLTKVAAALDVETATLKAAMAKVKAAIDATEARETKAEGDALLAAELGVSVEQMRTALAGVRGAGNGKCGSRGFEPAPEAPVDPSGT